MKTAIDNYSLGKQKESPADEYKKGKKFEKGRFTCPECGEDVHLTSSKYSNYFSHYQKKEIFTDCDRRVDGNSGLTIYERIGVPIYLRVNKNKKYSLSLGFRSLPTSILKIASDEKSYIEIKEKGIENPIKRKYSVNFERFSSELTTYIPIDFIPKSNNQYEIIFSDTMVSKSLKEYWSDYADGFSLHGALFSASKKGGRKVRHGDTVSINTEYYWVRRSEINLNIGMEIKTKLCGELIFDGVKFDVLRVIFESSLSDKMRFERLARYLKEFLNVFLLEKQPEVLPIWPPCISRGDNYEVVGRNNELTCIVSSGNETPKIMAYDDYKIRPDYINFTELDNGIKIVNFKVYNFPTMINVDRKVSGNGIYFKKIKSNRSKVNYEIAEKCNNNELKNLLGLRETRKDRELNLYASSPIEIIRIDAGNDISRYKNNESNIYIPDLRNKERVIFMSCKRTVYTAYICFEGTGKLSYDLDENELLGILTKNKFGERVFIPIGFRRLIKEMANEYKKSRRILLKYLNENTIPKKILTLLLERKNAND